MRNPPLEKTEMDAEPIPLLQLPLFVYGESITEVVELFPAVWKATEAVTSPDSTIKHRGMDALLRWGLRGYLHLWHT
jgi:hypothetical protein